MRGGCGDHTCPWQHLKSIRACGCAPGRVSTCACAGEKSSCPRGPSQGGPFSCWGGHPRGRLLEHRTQRWICPRGLGRTRSRPRSGTRGTGWAAPPGGRARGGGGAEVPPGRGNGPNVPGRDNAGQPGSGPAHRPGPRTGAICDPGNLTAAATTFLQPAGTRVRSHTCGDTTAPTPASRSLGFGSTEGAGSQGETQTPASQHRHPVLT